MDVLFQRAAQILAHAGDAAGEDNNLRIVGDDQVAEIGAPAVERTAQELDRQFVALVGAGLKVLVVDHIQIFQHTGFKQRILVRKDGQRPGAGVGFHAADVAAVAGEPR